MKGLFSTGSVHLRRLLLMSAMLLSNAANSQVLNDNIEQRICLKPESTFTTNTVNCSVQWQCINQSLTGHCIKFHNDQWFTFQVPSPGPYYINISNQQCRDLYGVQIVIIDGTPCDVQTYKILTCYSAGTQDDIFITLNGLEPAKSYLVNIDGYLHDFCTFDLTLSKTPMGLPVERIPDTQILKSYKKDSVVLEWDIPKDLVGSIQEFEVWKRNHTDTHHSLSQRIPVDRNTLGTSTTRYSHLDTRTPGQAVSYKIVGISEDSKILVDEIMVRYDTIIIDNAPENSLQFNLDYKKGTPLTILIFNKENNAILQNSEFLFDRNKHAQMTFYIGHLKEKGVQNYRVEIINNSNRQKQILTFSK